MELDEGYLEAFDFWAGAAEHAGGAPSFMGFAEFDITTDPTEAPADALLEAAGYYVEPGDECKLLWNGATVIHNRGGGMMRGGSTHSELTKNLTGWDPYSWDVKPDRVRLVGMAMADFSREAETGWVSEWFAPTKTPCTQCNGSGRVDGFLGVGIQIPCGECGGEGSR